MTPPISPSDLQRVLKTLPPERPDPFPHLASLTPDALLSRRVEVTGTIKTLEQERHVIDAELLSTFGDAELRFGVRAPGWCWEVQSVQEVGGAVVVTGRLTIPTADGDLLHYSAVVSDPLESVSKAPAAEVAASCCLRRAAALAGLGLELWG